MRRKPIELAAVATAAVPGLTPTAVSSAPDDPADFDAALLLDSEGKRWRVRSPRHAEASARLETEFLVLKAFAPAIRAELPFLMPTVAGSVRLGTLSTFVYSHLSGSTCSVEELTTGPEGLAREIGAALAAIHDLPRSLVNNADLPSYTPNEFRQRRLNELDQAATTGKIPPSLLLRWEHAMEDVSLWRFNPSVVHGDLHEDNLLVEGQRVTAVTGWTDLRIGDPADDFAWLVASNEQDFVSTVLAAYIASRRDTPDNHLLRRAALSAEFALAQYLVKGIAADDAGMIGEAEEMLRTLARDIEEHGGQPISVEPRPATSTPVTGSADGGLPVPLPSVSVVPVPVPTVLPAVHVTPIPVETAPAKADDAAGHRLPADAGEVSLAGDAPEHLPAGNAGEVSPAGDPPENLLAGNSSEGSSTGDSKENNLLTAANAAPGSPDDSAGDGPGPDDTSTAAISIVGIKQD